MNTTGYILLFFGAGLVMTAVAIGGRKKEEFAVVT
tara:strand:- start:391 stop:495 length:105 start_codon:yes stop_codon:yes gene_type:complete